MIEQTALAYVNMWGILGALEELCRLDPRAKEILRGLKHPFSLCFSVKNGPTNTFQFTSAGCRMTEGDAGCNGKMTFGSPEAFNRLISDSKPGLPVKGIVRTLTFLTGTFTALTDRLNEILRPSPEMLKNPDLLEENTLLTMYLLAGAIPALANYDSISKISASNTADGEISLGITGKAYATFTVNHNRYTVKKEKSAHPRAIMEFADVNLAHGLFAGEVSAINEMCKGTLKLAGNLSMVDNVNRILDRASVYLA